MLSPVPVAMTENMQALFSPRTVAVVGASPREASTSQLVLRNLRKLGFPGTIMAVNPRYTEVTGLPCYPSLSACPEVPDCVFIAVSAEQVIKTLEEAGRIGVRAAVVNASGFSDGGAEGRELQDRLTAIARKYGMALSGPNNMGLVNVHDRVAMWTALRMPELRPGPLAVIAQSGSVGVVLSQDHRRIGLSYVISAGNEAVCTAADYLKAVVRDPRVKVVALFLETVRDPHGFREAAMEAARRGVRILALKVGRTEAGRASVAAHTGALSGEDRVYDAYFRRLGIVRVADMDELLETAVLMCAHPMPPSERAVISLTVSGGQAALIADLAEQKVPHAALAPSTIDAITPAFPGFATIRNPVDAWGLGWEVDRFRLILDGLLSEETAGAIICAVDSTAHGKSDAGLGSEMAAVCIEAMAKTDKKFIFVNNTNSAGLDPDISAALDAVGIPYLSGMRTALAAVGLWLATEAVSPDAAAQEGTFPHPSGMRESARFALLAEAGLPMAPCSPVSNPDNAVQAAAKFGLPVVLKGTAPSIAHKTEHGLVRLGISSDDLIRAHVADLSRKLNALAPDDKAAEIVVQPQAADGVQLILGIRNDPSFGSVVVVGLGGTLVEVLNEASLRIGPVDEATARAMLAETKAATLLAGTRGKGPFDIDAAVKAIVALSRFGHSCRSAYASIEINPLIVHPAGVGATGVDIVIEPQQRTV
jgi:acetate---CoA ligase (ADP-forming)